MESSLQQKQVWRFHVKSLFSGVFTFTSRRFHGKIQQKLIVCVFTGKSPQWYHFNFTEENLKDSRFGWAEDFHIFFISRKTDKFGAQKVNSSLSRNFLFIFWFYRWAHTFVSRRLVIGQSSTIYLSFLTFSACALCVELPKIKTKTNRKKSRKTWNLSTQI